LPDGVLETVGDALIDGILWVALGTLVVVGDALVDGVVLGAALGIPEGIADGSTLTVEIVSEHQHNPCCPTAITTINDDHRAEEQTQLGEEGNQ
jgi:hypothetical protein